MSAPATSAGTRTPADAPATFLAWLVAATGCALLAARPALLATGAPPVALLTLLFTTLLVVGVAFPVPATPHVDGHGFAPGVAVGVAAFVAGRLLVGGVAPVHATVVVVLANSLAAIAEEAWFRRFCFALLEPAGPAVAVVGTTVLFAAVHVASYGAGVLPVDLAAGLLFGWQRVVSGSWRAPAATHVIANLAMLL